MVIAYCYWLLYTSSFHRVVVRKLRLRTQLKSWKFACKSLEKLGREQAPLLWWKNSDFLACIKYIMFSLFCPKFPPSVNILTLYPTFSSILYSIFIILYIFELKHNLAAAPWAATARLLLCEISDREKCSY